MAQVWVRTHTILCFNAHVSSGCCVWLLSLRRHLFHLCPHHLLSYHPVFPSARQLHLPGCGGQFPCALPPMRTLAPWPRTSLSHPMRSNQNLRVFWKLMNPPECVWETLNLQITKTILQEKVTIHCNITIWFTKLFLCLKPWKLLQQTLNKVHQHHKWHQQKSWISYTDCQACAGQAADAVSRKTHVEMIFFFFWKLPNRKVQTFGFVYHDKKMAKVMMVQYGRPNRSSWTKSVWSSFSRTIMGKAIWESPIETWLGGKFQIGNVCSYTE